MNAIISDCGKYRYMLRRDLLTIRDADPAVFVMLNPSIADATEDDPTIRRCMGFATSWGCDELIVVNLYALRATNPKELWKAHDPFGPENHTMLRDTLRRYKKAVCAWGANAKPEAVKQFQERAEFEGASLYCLGVTKAGAPRHPLYLKRDTPLQPWPDTAPRRQKQ